MGAVYFYHLTESPVEQTLPSLLGKARSAGWRVVVRGSSAERMGWLDEKLWLGPEEGFLPHGLAGGPNDALQPILLTVSSDDDAGAACVMCVDGAEIAAETVSRLERTCILFDGNTPEAVEAARRQWKTLTGAGISAQYWAQEDGRWVKKAETD